MSLDLPSYHPAETPLPQDGRVLLDATLLKRLRKTRGLSQEALADLCFQQQLCVSIASIKRAETGKIVLYRTARHLAQVFGVALEDLTIEQAAPAPSPQSAAASAAALPPAPPGFVAGAAPYAAGQLPGHVAVHACRPARRPGRRVAPRGDAGGGAGRAAERRQRRGARTGLRGAAVRRPRSASGRLPHLRRVRPAASLPQRRRARHALRAGTEPPFADPWRPRHGHAPGALGARRRCRLRRSRARPAPLRRAACRRRAPLPPAAVRGAQPAAAARPPLPVRTGRRPLSRLSRLQQAGRQRRQPAAAADRPLRRNAPVQGRGGNHGGKPVRPHHLPACHGGRGQEPAGAGIRGHRAPARHALPPRRGAGPGRGRRLEGAAGTAGAQPARPGFAAGARQCGSHRRHRGAALPAGRFRPVLPRAGRRAAERRATVAVLGHESRGARARLVARAANAAAAPGHDGAATGGAGRRALGRPLSVRGARPAAVAVARSARAVGDHLARGKRPARIGAAPADGRPGPVRVRPGADGATRSGRAGRPVRRRGPGLPRPLRGARAGQSAVPDPAAGQPRPAPAGQPAPPDPGAPGRPAARARAGAAHGLRAGPPLRPGLLRAALGQPDYEPQAAGRDSLLRALGSAGAYGFVHDLVMHCIYDAIDPPSSASCTCRRPKPGAGRTPCNAHTTCTAPPIPARSI